jgi:hypothetical protein
MSRTGGESSGETGEGLAVIAEALTLAEASGARGNEAELNRSRGDLLRRLPSSDRTEIEAAYRTAPRIAREQGTRGIRRSRYPCGSNHKMQP